MPDFGRIVTGDVYAFEAVQSGIGVVDRHGQVPIRLHPEGGVIVDALAPAPWITKVLSSRLPIAGSSEVRLVAGVDPVPVLSLPDSGGGGGSGGGVGVGGGGVCTGVKAGV